jgi:hypothetical protein
MKDRLREAACIGSNPTIFDQYLYPEAALGIAICKRCTVTAECLEYVRPQKSGFDGVAGGLVWRNGYRVRFDNSTREDRLIRMRKEAGGLA